MRSQHVPLVVLCLLCLLGFLGTTGLCEEPGGEPRNKSGSNSAGTNGLLGTAAVDVFDPNHVVEVDIKLAPKDWEVLRHEGRGLASTWSGYSSDFEYTYFKATVTVDGRTFEDVGVRKKGYLGSLSVVRPSLKINFATFVAGRTWRGRRRMTLNNDRQDPSHTHQVMCYALFRKAGCAAPRCNFARVTVNGKKLGVFSHVECIKEPFLARCFQDSGGNLYEGQVADFTVGLVSKFERKTNKDVHAPGTQEPDRSDLNAVILALKANDADLLAALEKVIDVEAFLTFWAMEVITGHWDGYTGDRNNFYIYRLPKTGLFHFIPWGTDGAFAKGHVFLPGIPDSVYAWSQISYRLYSNPKTRSLYHRKLKSLLNEIWDEKALLAEVDRIEKLVSPDKQAVEKQRKFIVSRKKSILEELSDAGPAWPHAPITKSRKLKKPVAISGTFSATWGSKDSFLPNTKLSITLTLNGKSQVFSGILNAAGMNDDPNLKGTAVINYYCIRASDKNLYIALSLMPSLIKKGEAPFHGFETFGVVVKLDEKTGRHKMIGFIGDGKITFTAAGTKPGDKISGGFTGLLSQEPE